MNRPGWTAAATIALLAIGSAARAEDDRALSAEAGFATFSTQGKKVGTMQPPELAPDGGGTLGMVYEHSLGADFSLRGEAAGAIFSGGTQAKQKESQTSFAGLADVGAVFRFDVLRDVPYAFAGVGGVVSGGGPLQKGADFVLVVGGGLDVLQSRSRSWGGEVRVASFGGNITVVTIGLRGTIRWGYL